MSRGPGRIMRAALAELELYDTTTAYGVAVRVIHDVMCGCDEHKRCCRLLDQPTRVQLVAARRALHTLARQGVVELYRIRTYDHPPALAAKRCQPRQSPDLATHTALPCFFCNTPTERRNFRRYPDCGNHRVPPAPCHFCGRDDVPARGMSNGWMVCDECMSETTNVLALAQAGQWSVGGAS